MSWKSSFVCVLLLLGVTRGPICSQEPARQAVLEEALANGIALGIPGISVAVGQGDRIVWQGTAGFRDVVGGEPVASTDRFGIGSITKTFVAALVLELVGEGKLDLDKPATEYLDLDVVARVPNAGVAPLRTLLNHQSGIPTWEFNERWIRDGRGAAMDLDHVWDKTETLTYLLQDGAKADFPPGERYAYSNTNYTILGLVVEAVTGNELPAEIRSRLLEPAGMADTFFESFEDIPGGYVHHYHYATPEFARVAGLHLGFPRVGPHLAETTAANLSPEWAAGGMVASAPDLVRWAQALSQGKVLGATMQAELLTHHLPREGSGGTFQYLQGLARMEDYVEGRTFVGHSGGTLGFTAMLYWIEGTDISIACLMNVGTMHTGLAHSPPSLFFSKILVPAIMAYLEGSDDAGA